MAVAAVTFKIKITCKLMVGKSFLEHVVLGCE
jgi:hypothetical protein